MTYPITANTRFVNAAAIHDYMRILFGDIELTADDFVCLRAIGEKGTPKEGVHREDIFLQPDLQDVDEMAAQYAVNWAQYHVAGFVVPAILKEARGSSEAVSFFTCLMVDLDDGDTDAKLAHLTQHVGQPSMVVWSGGSTAEGRMKRHVYWRLTEPVRDIPRYIAVRDAISRKGGGDMQFGLGVDSNKYGRAHQPIRIAGTCHAKSGEAKECALLECNENRFDWEDIEAAVAAMPAGPWFTPEQAAEIEIQRVAATSKTTVDYALTHEIHEGGDAGRNRFSEASKVIGFYISLARQGRMTLADAKRDFEGWLLRQMTTPWPQDRIDHEWGAVLKLDIDRSGPIVENKTNIQPLVPEQYRHMGLSFYAVNRWTQGAPPGRRFLVDGLLLWGKQQMLAAEGGAGKTYLLLDLFLKIALKGKNPEKSYQWCGQEIKSGGPSVLLTTEDDRDEIHQRMEEIDPGGALRLEAGDDYMILPLINITGAFPLYCDQTDRPTQKWNEVMSYLVELRAARGLAVVGIDTLSSTFHGNENDATAAGEWMRMLNMVPSQTGAAAIVTHHVRKAGKEPIRNAKDFLSAIRGSTAIPSAMRCVLGIWQKFSKFKGENAEIPEGAELFSLAVCKANNPEMLKTEKVLLRQPFGLLTDVTKTHKSAEVEGVAMRSAWLELAIKLAAIAGHPYTTEKKSAQGGCYARRSEMPKVLFDDEKAGRAKGVSPSDYEFMIRRLIESGRVVVCSVKGGSAKKFLDVPTGPLATNQFGAEVNKGSYSNRPEWGDYIYAHELDRVVLKSERNMAFGGLERKDIGDVEFRQYEFAPPPKA